MGKQLIPSDSGDVQENHPARGARGALLAYALSTIMHRALPDARDGLKPVHRRILYGMQLLRLDPDRRSRSRQDRRRRDGQLPSARRPGDLRRAGAARAGFRSRYPLVDGQGNFGNIDGDNPPPTATPRRA
jgi:topoisomerase-4 subunit A